MLLYKMIGSFGIIASALIIYFEMQKYEKLKLNQINAFILLIEYIKNQIECYLLPIDAIIHNCDIELIKACGIDSDLPNAKNLEELIESAVFYCDKGSADIIKQFSRDFGQSYVGEQLRFCDYYKNELLKQRDRIKEKGLKEQKVRLALCLCASFSLILLLI
jgi:hypothetical protein